jgi:hypothetical protein
MQSTNNHPLLICRPPSGSIRATRNAHHAQHDVNVIFALHWPVQQTPNFGVLEKSKYLHSKPDKFSSKTYWIEEFSSCLDECWEFWPRPSSSLTISSSGKVSAPPGPLSGPAGGALPGVVMVSISGSLPQLFVAEAVENFGRGHRFFLNFRVLFLTNSIVVVFFL